MFFASVVPAASLARSMNGTLIQVASGPAPSSAPSTSVSSLASEKITASFLTMISLLKRAKSFQLKTTRMSTKSAWAKISSPLRRTVVDDSPPRICGP